MLDHRCGVAAGSESAATFYCYGACDPFYDQFLADADAVEEAGVSAERLQLDDMPLGFENQGGWIPPYAQWLNDIFEND